MTTLYLIRHGQSEANLKRIFAGDSEFPLTDLGKNQAALAAEYLKDKDIDIVYASPINRAFNTGKAVSDLINIPIVTNDGLKEINAGLWEGRHFDDLETDFAESYGIWRNDIGKAQPDGGESVADLYDRVISAITEIARKNDGKTIAIASHATPIRAFGAFCMGISKEALKDLPWPANTSITSVKYEDEKFFDIDYNYCEHLGEVLTKLPANV